MSINSLFYKYLIYYPVTIIRLEFPGFNIKKLLQSQYFNNQEMESLQNTKLLKLIEHSIKNTDHYKKSFNNKIYTLKTLSEAPTLEKEQLRGNEALFISKKFCGLKRSKTTGGSTGAPVTIQKNNIGMANELAATWRGYAWAGVDIGDKQARFWGVPHSKAGKLKAKLIDLVTNRIRLSAFSFSDEDLYEYTEKLNKHKPKYFYGYVSMIRQYAEFIEKNNITLNFNLKCIITTSEVLTSIDRKFLEKIFKCKVYNEYGCGEIGTVAHECNHGSMHITAENMIVEIIDSDNKPLQDNQVGEIVITDLTNFSMPLIRYKMKDYGSIEHKECACGIKLPILSNIHGREYDMLINSEGKKFHGEFFLYMVEDAKKNGVILNGFQIEQTAYNKLLIKAVCDHENVKKLSDFMAPVLKEKFNDNGVYIFESVNEIKRENSGKLRVIKRNIIEQE